MVGAERSGFYHDTPCIFVPRFRVVRMVMAVIAILISFSISLLERRATQTQQDEEYFLVIMGMAVWISCGIELI
jgi:hypothetical protein